MMKGYYISDGFMGFVDGTYMLFANEQDYYEYMEEWNNDGKRKNQSAAA